MYTFNADCITSYELGSEEPSTLAINNVNLFTASADDILSRMAKVRVICDASKNSWSCCVSRCLREWVTLRRQFKGLLVQRPVRMRM